MSPMERQVRDFVRADAEGDAWSTAAERCGGDAELIEGRKGHSPNDYRCPPQGEIPRAYACAMDNGSTIFVSVLTDMSGELRDGEKILRLRYPTLQ